ncbi:hypothetical protein [Rhodoflexus sp.]
MQVYRCKLYTDDNPEPFSTDWDKLPRLIVERHSFYVIGENISAFYCKI